MEIEGVNTNYVPPPEPPPARQPAPPEPPPADEQTPPPPPPDVETLERAVDIFV